MDEAGLRSRVLATMHTGGKALALAGRLHRRARDCCREYLTNRCRHLIFTTALPPAIGAWWLAGNSEACEATIDADNDCTQNAGIFRAELDRATASRAMGEASTLSRS